MKVTDLPKDDFEIEERPPLVIIQCKHCSERWSWPKRYSALSIAAALELLDHKAKHDESK